MNASLVNRASLVPVEREVQPAQRGQFSMLTPTEGSTAGVHQFIDELKLHTGIADDALAERVLTAVLESLGDVLLPEEASLIEEALPEELASRVHAGVEQGFAAGDFDDLIDGVEWREKTGPSTACEHATAVLEILARSLEPEVRQNLSAHLPPSIARHLDARTIGGTSAGRRPSGAMRGPEHTLATGRPGSLHPLSEAKPETAHSQSVARAAEPHADTKLSSSPGLTQERLHETLSEGNPGPRRRLSGQ